MKRAAPNGCNGNGNGSGDDAKRARTTDASDIDYLRMMLTCPSSEVATMTPVVRARILSERSGGDVFLKREDTQLTFSHHLRWAYTLVSNLSSHEAGVDVIVAAGLGNFPYAVAHSITLLRERLAGGSGSALRLVLVLPRTTSPFQLRQLDALKATLASSTDARSIAVEVAVSGSNQEEALVAARARASQEKTTAPDAAAVHLLQNHDGEEGIGALGSVGVELFAQMPVEPDAIYVAVGSGTHAAALAEYAAMLSPDTTIVAVEAERNTATSAAVKGEERAAPALNHFVEGTAVATPGQLAVSLLKKHAKSVRFVTVTNDEVCAAIKAVFLDTRAILEPAGALAVAGLKKDSEAGSSFPLKGLTAAAVLGSANMEFTALRTVAERCEEGERLVTVELPEAPAAFRKMYAHVYPCPVTEFSYRYSGEDGRNAIVYMSFLPSGKEAGDSVIRGLDAGGFKTQSLGDNEMAKSHARYLVGGRGAPPDERLFQFRFPENTDALRQFLAALPSFVNITLFHYRNHGADFGKVLVGFNVPSQAELSFQKFLADVAYEYTDETLNPVYRLFLR